MNALAQSVVSIQTKLGKELPVRIIVGFPNIRPWALIEIENFILLSPEKLERIKGELAFASPRQPPVDEIRDLARGTCMGIEIERFGSKPDHEEIRRRLHKIGLPADAWPELDQ